MLLRRFIGLLWAPRSGRRASERGVGCRTAADERCWTDGAVGPGRRALTGIGLALVIIVGAEQIQLLTEDELLFYASLLLWTMALFTFADRGLGLGERSGPQAASSGGDRRERGDAGHDHLVAGCGARRRARRAHGRSPGATPASVPLTAYGAIAGHMAGGRCVLSFGGSSGGLFVYDPMLRALVRLDARTR